MNQTMRGLPRPRTLVHPGPAGAVRIEHLCAGRARQFRLALPPGASLHDGIVNALAAQGVRSASMTLLGGTLESLHYCLAVRDTSGRHVAIYGSPIAARNAGLLFGNATLGISAESTPVVHCHAAFCVDGNKAHGGHLLADRCRVGAVPVIVLVTALEGIALRVGFDEETRLPLLRPHREPFDA